MSKYRTALGLVIGTGLITLVLTYVPAGGQDDFSIPNPSDPFGDVDPGTLPGADSGEGTLPSDEGAPVAAPGQEEQLTEEQIKALGDETTRLLESDAEADLEQAVKNTEILRRYAPTSPLPFLWQGKAYTKLEQNTFAVTAFNNAIALSYNVQFYEPYFELGKLELSMRRFREAKEHLETALQYNPKSADVNYYHGKAAFRAATQLQFAGREALQELMATAEASLTQSIRLRDDYADAYAERALARTSLGKLDEAIDDLKTAHRLEPVNAEYSARLGLVLSQRADNGREDRWAKEKDNVPRDYRDAIESYTTFLDAKGDSDTEGRDGANNDQAADDGPANDDVAAADDGMSADDVVADSPTADEAETEEDPDASKPEEIYVRRAAARIALAEILNNEESAALYRAAADDCTASLDIEPHGVGAYYNRGVALRMLGDFATAVESFTDAIELSGSPDAQLRRGIVYYHMGDYDLAMGDFQASRTAAAQDPRPAFWEGVVYAIRGDHAEAVRSYTEALHRFPGYTPAYNNRGLSYMYLQRYDRAAADFAELVRRDPHDAVSAARREEARQLQRQQQAVARY
ncbi:MAG: tetratricopeptide repeat protein [Pirellulaceae bacterium]|nr:tetratricopeptide repeat protein [Planctomycetales bacterium]